MADYCRSESNDCFYEWFSESVIHPSQRFGFRFEHKRKHHIVAHRLDNQWEIAVICFALATIVLMREFRTPKRETSELSAHTVRSVFCLSFFFFFFFFFERAAANPSSGRSFRHYDIKRIHTPYYTEHSKKAFGKQCFCSFEHACQHFK